MTENACVSQKLTMFPRQNLPQVLTINREIDGNYSNSPLGTIFLESTFQRYKKFPNSL